MTVRIAGKSQRVSINKKYHQL